jgi:hypothetical protein
VTESDEPPDDADSSLDPFDGDDEGKSAAPGGLGAMGQLTLAALVVLALVALFIAAAVAFRRLLP